MSDPIDPSKPGAGGWVPTPGQRALGVGLVSTFGSLAIGLPASFPGSRAALVGGIVCGALGLGITAALGMNSAGPRTGV